MHSQVHGHIDKHTGTFHCTSVYKLVKCYHILVHAHVHLHTHTHIVQLLKFPYMIGKHCGKKWQLQYGPSSGSGIYETCLNLAAVCKIIIYCI